MTVNKRIIYLLCILLLPALVSCRKNIRPDIKGVVLISIDTMRADHLRCYGYERKTSPTMDSLAQSGTRWTACQAQSPWTLPSHASIWTGLSVDAHGTTWDECGMHILDPSLPSLPVLLGDAGFKTAAFTNVAYLSPAYGFDVGFDDFAWHPNGAGKARNTVNSSISWLMQNAVDEEPFFLFIHFFDVHAPYAPPVAPSYFFEDADSLTDISWENFAEYSDEIFTPANRRGLLDLYDTEIRCVDDQLKRLFTQVRSMGIADSLLVIVVSDHGEEFYEHGGWGHGHTLYQGLLNVPLIMSGPGIDAGVVDSSVVGLIDILPTVLEYLKVEVPETVEGIDILNGCLPVDRGIVSGGVTPLREIELSNKGDSIIVSTNNSLRCVRIGSKKIFWAFHGDSIWTYDLLTDPFELSPLSDTFDYREIIEKYIDTQVQAYPDYVVFTDSTINEALEGLGYLK